jgi:hypothetical protein
MGTIYKYLAVFLGVLLISNRLPWAVCCPNLHFPYPKAMSTRNI